MGSAAGRLHGFDADACEVEKRIIMYGESFAQLGFTEAAAIWLRERKNLSARTKNDYTSYIESLTAFFGHAKLSTIHIGMVAKYQRERQAAIRKTIRHKAIRTAVRELPSDGASRINHEISTLGQILQRAKLWESIKAFYEPLPLPSEKASMALSPEEEQHLFQVARTKKRWMIAYCCTLLSRNTTAGPGEIRNLRLMDIDIDSPHGAFIHIVEGVKNEFRKRPLPLNDDAQKAIRWLLDHARSHGATQPHHYLLPNRTINNGRLWDPTRPMGSWKTAFRSMRKEAAKEYPRLATLRPYDLRHTACTDLLQDPSVSFTTIEHMMGHRLNSRTKREYDHLRNSALRGAAEALNKKHLGHVDELQHVKGKRKVDAPKPKPMQASAVGAAASASTGRVLKWQPFAAD